MALHRRISVTVAGTTRDQLDRFAERRGLKKKDVVEQALLAFMEARQALPDEAFVNLSALTSSSPGP